MPQADLERSSEGNRMSRIPVVVMGATGVVGQRFVALLGDHPTMEIVALVASGKREGKRYSETVDWLVDVPLPDEVEALKVTTIDEEDLFLGPCHGPPAVSIEGSPCGLPNRSFKS
jgi:molybdopterin/thiamine biosynthesis adenylyltransferase